MSTCFLTILGIIKDILIFKNHYDLIHITNQVDALKNGNDMPRSIEKLDNLILI